MHSTRSRLLVLLLALPGALLAAPADKSYRTSGDCDGFPAVSLTTAPGLCVGLVASHLGFVRGVAAIGRDIFVVDMGGWQSRHGRLLRLADGGRHAPEVVLHDLFQPNAIVPGPGKTLYVGITGQVLQVDPYARDPAQGARVVVAGLPVTGRHPMPALAVGADGALFVNIGSATDNCHGPAGALPDPRAPCPETLEKPPRGALLRLPPRAATYEAGAQAPWARGLRNSMALAVLPDGRLAAASNSRDAIDHVAPALSDADLPHETLDVVQSGGDYGWPYYYDNLSPSPEYPSFDCRGKHAPAMLLPAHAAPLGMILYRGDRLPGLRGRLVIGYHGYRATGHRIVAVALDAKSVPGGTPTELVTDWGDLPGAHPQGAPVGLFEMADGSLLIAEDHNGSLLRLSRKTTK